MRTVWILVGLVAVTNAAALVGAWRNRSQVRSEVVLTEKNCWLSRATRDRSIAMLTCHIFAENSRLDEKRMRELGFSLSRSERDDFQLRRLGFALVQANPTGAVLLDFALDARSLEMKFSNPEGRAIVRAQVVPRHYISSAPPPPALIQVLMPAMPVPTHQQIPRAPPGKPDAPFSAKIRIGRNYEPWLVALRPR